MPEHILVIGATGPTGIEFCSAALNQGHQLTLYVRSPQKLPTDIFHNANVSIIEGTLEDISKLEEAASSGARVFVSFAGPTTGSKGTPVTDVMCAFFPVLQRRKFKRAMILGTCSYTAPEDKGALKWKLSVVFVKLIGGSAYQEFKGLGEFITSQDATMLKWTLFRVPFLTNSERKEVRATYTGTGEDGLFLSRKSMVGWVLDELRGDSQWVGRAPVLSE